MELAALLFQSLDLAGGGDAYGTDPDDRDVSVGPQQPTVVDVAAVRVGATGVQWLRPDGSLTSTPTFAAPQYLVTDTTVTIPWRESAPGRYALAVVFYHRGSPIDDTFVEYEVTAADVP